MSKPFASFQTEETAILEVTKLLEDHAAARQAATLEHTEHVDLTCWYCSFPVRMNEAAFVIGEGSHEMFPLHRACLDGCTQAIAEVPRGFEDRPIHGYIESLPGLTPQDVKRLNQIAEFVNGPHAKVVGPIVSTYMPYLVQREGPAS